MHPSPAFRSWRILAVLAWPALSGADDLQPLGDEFNHAGSIAQWRDIQQVENWGSDQLEQWDIHTTTPGMMRITPRTSGWYNQLRGALVFKDVTGDFVCTTRLRIRSRHNPANQDEVPNRRYSLAGIFAHVPKPAGFRGAPDPYVSTDYPAQVGTPVYPYPGSGSSWQPFTENYLFLSFGAADAPNVRKYEVKSTRDSRSLLYYNNIGYSGAIPNTAAYGWVELQMVRVSNRVVVLRRHPDGVGGWGQWIVENRYPNTYQNQFPLTGSSVQLGITTYTDFDSINGSYYFYDDNPGMNSAEQQRNRHRQWQHNYTTLQTGQNVHGGNPHTPDLITDLEYFRIERPHPNVTVAALDALPTTFVNQGNQSLQLLPASGAGQYLGNAANTPLGEVAFSAPAFSANEREGTATISVTRSGPSQDRALSVSYAVTGGTAMAGADFTATSGTLTWAANDPATKTFTVPIVSHDRLAEGAETATLTLSGLDGPATFAASVPTLSAMLTIEDAPYDAWRTTHFGANANGPEAQPDVDADEDGLPNLVEFALDTAPRTPTASPAVAGVQGGYMTLTFPRHPASDPVTYIVQAADDVTGLWADIATRPPGGPWTTAPGASVTEGASVTVTDPVAMTTTSTRVMRLRVVIP